MADRPRPTVDQYFMDMTHLVKARGTCPRRLVGAVIVKDKRVLTTGYNGAPRNFSHPIDVGCLRDELNIPRGMVADICPCLHAEQNAILQAATTGVSIDGADLYVTTQPCTQCSRMVANCGVRRVVFDEEYPDPLAVGILTTAGVELWKWDHATRTAQRMERTNTFEEAQEELRRRWKSQPPPLAPKLPMAGSSSVPVPLPPPSEVPHLEHDAWRKGDEAGPDAREKAPVPQVTRDITKEPDRAELLRRLARQKVEEKRRKAPPQ